MYYWSYETALGSSPPVAKYVLFAKIIYFIIISQSFSFFFIFFN
jgi:hypothetical protein